MLWLHGKDPLKPDTNTYIITGDSGQGMTGGTIGGIVVSDEILGEDRRIGAAQAGLSLVVITVTGYHWGNG